MAGTRHHFIPRFLMKGFQSHANGDEIFAWVLRRDREPYNTNIKNISVEGHFYTLDESPHIDDAITDAEQEFSSLVVGLRDERCSPVDSRHVARLIANLEVRTRHVRLNLELIGDAFLRHVRTFVDDEQAITRLVRQQIESEPEQFLSVVKDELVKQGVDHRRAKLAAKAALPGLLNQSLPSILATVRSTFRHVLENQPVMLKAMARRGQLRALERAVSPEVKVAWYERLDFSVFDTQVALPLGDSAVIFEVSGDRRFTTFTSADDNLLAAYLPLSPSKVLVGTSPGFVPRLEDLPEAIARCSYEYIVAASDAPEVRELSQLISENAELLSEETMQGLLSEALPTSIRGGA